MRFMRWLSMLSLTIPMCVWGQAKAKPSEFVLDPTKPFAFLQFDHMGLGEKVRESESPNRLWFKLVNNCHLPLVIHTFGSGPEALPNETGVMDLVIANESSGDGVVTIVPFPVNHDNPFVDEKPQATASKEEIMPFGYWFHVGSFMSIPPGKAVLFSLPSDQFNSRWHIEIPFEFEIQRIKPQHSNIDIGGTPHLTIWYSLGDLPPQIQQVLAKK